MPKNNPIGSRATAYGNALERVSDMWILWNDKITFLNKGDYDEIAFVLGINGSSKTFYVKNQEKIRSNIDVSSLVDYEEGEPTFESLIKISLDIIRQAS